MAKSPTVDALEYLADPLPDVPKAVTVVFGGEAFLKREVLRQIRQAASGEGEGEFSFSVFLGDNVDWRDVRDSLATVSLFSSGGQLVIIEEADKFVTRHRRKLEDYVEKREVGILVLDVKSLPRNTRLAKLIHKHGLAIECNSPTEARAKKWLTDWAQRQHNVTMPSAAADALWELLPPEMGILQQEIAKLALLVGEERVINVDLVKDHVGGWRSQTAWQMVDAITNGNARRALEQLDRLLAAGEQPIVLLAQLAGTLRRFAAATQIIELGERSGQRKSLSAALEEAGVRSFRLRESEQQLRRIGRQRAKRLNAWLLSCDLAMKSHNSTIARARSEIERLIVELRKS